MSIYDNYAGVINVGNTLSEGETIESAFIINGNFFISFLKVLFFGGLVFALMGRSKKPIPIDTPISKYSQGLSIMCLTNKRLITYNRGFWSLKKAGAMRASCNISDVLRVETSDKGSSKSIRIDLKGGRSLNGWVQKQYNSQVQVFINKINGSKNS